MVKIYVDVCCWNRPFDDQTQARVHLEAEAVLMVIAEIEAGNFQLLHSEIADLEIASTPDLKRRQRLQAIIPWHKHYIRTDADVLDRAVELESNGFAGVDALHLASAESAHAEVFLTTDDRLLRRAARNINFLRVTVANPLTWMQNKS